MPLKGTPQETWTWAQSVAWIGFDISDPINGNVYDWGVLSSQSDEGNARQVSEKALRAIVELVGAVCDGSLEVLDTPFPGRRSRFRLRPFDPRNLSASEKDSICKFLHRQIRGGEVHPLATIPDEYSFFWGARFSRDVVMRIWPDTTTGGADEGKAAELPEPTDPKSSAVRPKRAGRKKGSGSYDSEDAPLLKEIEALVENEKPMALWNAALSVADRAPGKTIISRAKRLVIKYKERPDLR